MAVDGTSSSCIFMGIITSMREEKHKIAYVKDQIRKLFAKLKNGSPGDLEYIYNINNKRVYLLGNL